MALIWVHEALEYIMKLSAIKCHDLVPGDMHFYQKMPMILVSMNAVAKYPVDTIFSLNFLRRENNKTFIWSITMGGKTIFPYEIHRSF